jgi:hypothetical protein
MLRQPNDSSRALLILALTFVHGWSAFGDGKEGDLSALAEPASRKGCEAVNESVRFLRPGETRDRVAVASYPRSGNSLTRSMTQAISGIYSGSDMGGGIPGATKIVNANGKSTEKIYDETVFAIKTHW